MSWDKRADKKITKELRAGHRKRKRAKAARTAKRIMTKKRKTSNIKHLFADLFRRSTRNDLS